MKKDYFLPNEFMIIQFFQTKDFLDIMFDGQIYKIIGKDDVGNLVGISLSNQVFLLHSALKNKIYISKNLEAFLEEIKVYHSYSELPLPDNPSEDELEKRESHFRKLLTQIDENACADETTYWSSIVEEMGYGII